MAKNMFAGGGKAYSVTITLTFRNAHSAAQVERWAQDQAERIQERMDEALEECELSSPSIRVSRATRE